MGILDEAIREHLELKRQHGADDSELKQLEDEAFGPPERPGAEEAGLAVDEGRTELMTAPETAEEPGPDEEAGPRREPPAALGDLQEAPPPPEEAAPAEPGDEEEPAAEHEAVAEPGTEAATPGEGDGAPKAEPAEDREAITEQPTEHFDVEEELGASAAEPGPTDEELVEEEMDEPRLAPLDPLAVEEAGEIEVEAAPEAAGDEKTPAAAAPVDADEYEDEDDEFWSDQRLSEELDNALDAPLDPGGPQTAEAPGADAPEEAAGPEPVEGAEGDEEDTFRGPAPDRDVLEDTPDFLEDAPEDDELWFEQKPPKDFDFDD
jgi:hypothetical protein